eukprot:scaffold45387_cov57-Attheya_sp.AAC.3
MHGKSVEEDRRQWRRIEGIVIDIIRTYPFYWLPRRQATESSCMGLRHTATRHMVASFLSTAVESWGSVANEKCEGGLAMAQWNNKKRVSQKQLVNFASFGNDSA